MVSRETLQGQGYYHFNITGEEVMGNGPPQARINPLPPCLGLLGEEPGGQRSPVGDARNAGYMFLPFLYSAAYPYFGWALGGLEGAPGCCYLLGFGSALWVSRARSREGRADGRGILNSSEQEAMESGGSRLGCRKRPLCPISPCSLAEIC